MTRSLLGGFGSSLCGGDGRNLKLNSTIAWRTTVTRSLLGGFGSSLCGGDGRNLKLKFHRCLEEHSNEIFAWWLWVFSLWRRRPEPKA